MSSKDPELLGVSYDPTRDIYKEVNDPAAAVSPAWHGRQVASKIG